MGMLTVVNRNYNNDQKCNYYIVGFRFSRFSISFIICYSNLPNNSKFIINCENSFAFSLVFDVERTWKAYLLIIQPLNRTKTAGKMRYYMILSQGKKIKSHTHKRIVISTS